MMKTLGWTSGLAVVLIVYVAQSYAQELDPDPYDRTVANGCKECHAPGELYEIQSKKQTFIYADWINSGHANSWEEITGNTYCMQCHAPFQADPDATHDERVDVPIEASEAVTCLICHPDHNVRDFFETPIGNYIVGSIDKPNDQGVMDGDNPVMGSWIPVAEEDAGDLCTYCHTGSHHTPRKLNHMKSFQCTTCHMPDVDLTVDYTDDSGAPQTKVVQVRSHRFGWPLDDPEALAAKAEAACVGCHTALGLAFVEGGGTSVEDAVAAIKGGLVHNDKPIPDAGGPYAGFVGRSITLDASNSTDREGDALTFSWDFGDGSPATEPSASPTAEHTYTEPGSYTAKVTVADAPGNVALAKSADVEIQIPQTDDWNVRLPLTNEALAVSFEPFAGILIVRTTAGGAESPMLGVGMEMDNLIFWMNATGEMFFGNVDRDAGTMSGIVFGGPVGSGFFFGESL